MEAPFYVGQRVVVLEQPHWGPLNKGDIVVVGSLTPCQCGTYHVGLVGHESLGKSTCHKCGIRNHTTHRGGPHYFFAPIQGQFSDITEEIAKESKETHEIHDQPARILKPEKVN